MFDCWVQMANLDNSNQVVRKDLPLFHLLNQETTGLQYRFSAFWLRSKCSICSYQLNIWYGDHVSPSILNLFLSGDEDLELAPALSWVGLVLQYHQDRPTSPLITNNLVHHDLLINDAKKHVQTKPCPTGAAQESTYKKSHFIAIIS